MFKEVIPRHPERIILMLLKYVQHFLTPKSAFPAPSAIPYETTPNVSYLKHLMSK